MAYLRPDFSVSPGKVPAKKWFGPSPGYRIIIEGERARNGDRYHLGNGDFAVVGKSTFVQEGDAWPAQCMCYHPERPLTLREPS
jgi:hypothetical protein